MATLVGGGGVEEDDGVAAGDHGRRGDRGDGRLADVGDEDGIGGAAAGEGVEDGEDPGTGQGYGGLEDGVGENSVAGPGEPESGHLRGAEGGGQEGIVEAVYGEVGPGGGDGIGIPGKEDGRGVSAAVVGKLDDEGIGTGPTNPGVRDIGRGEEDAVGSGPEEGKRDGIRGDERPYVEGVLPASEGIGRRKINGRMESVLTDGDVDQGGATGGGVGDDEGVGARGTDAGHEVLVGEEDAVEGEPLEGEAGGRAEHSRRKGDGGIAAGDGRSGIGLELGPEGVADDLDGSHGGATVGGVGEDEGVGAESEDGGIGGALTGEDDALLAGPVEDGIGGSVEDDGLEGGDGVVAGEGGRGLDGESGRQCIDGDGDGSGVVAGDAVGGTADLELVGTAGGGVDGG